MSILDSVGIVSTSILATASVLQGAMYIKSKSNNCVSWRVVEKGVKKVLKDISDDAFVPDCIFPMGRGGCVIAGMISNKFRANANIPIYMVDRSLSTQNNVRDILIKDGFVKLIGTPGKVLLVGGINASGGSLSKYQKWLAESGASEVRSAVLFTGHTSTVQPKYFYKKVAIEPKKLKLPWYGKGLIDWV